MDVRGGPGEVVYVLLLLQAGTGLLASAGELALMGSPLYLVVPAAKAAALLVLAAKIMRGRRWAMVAAIVLSWAGLLGMWVGVLLGLLPGLAPAVTLTGLLTGVALPVAVIVLCARLLAASRRPARPPGSAAGWVTRRSAGWSAGRPVVAG